MGKTKKSIIELEKEIKRLKKEITQLHSEVDYDHMVHFVLNRRGLNSRFLPIIHEVKGGSGKRRNHLYSIDEVACVFADVDRFKKINDSLGHDVGDKIIILLGGILREKFRETDLVCRYGGDEFVVIVFNSPEKHTSEKMRDVSAAFEKQASKLAPKIKPTISYGVSYLKEGFGDTHSLIKAAGQRMKAEKSAKKLWAFKKPW